MESSDPCRICGLPLSLYRDALDMGDGTAIHGVCPSAARRAEATA